MARWEPNGRQRLEAAALALYLERGFEQTTVAEIAGRAGLTERTFYRHFADKREVLFSGAVLLRDAMVDGVDAAPQGTTPGQAVVAGLTAGAALFDGRRTFARRRQRVIDANPELQERELIKLAGLAGALAQALGRRAVAAVPAALAAEAGVVVFKSAFEQWLVGRTERQLADLVRSAFGDLQAVMAD